MLVREPIPDLTPEVGNTHLWERATDPFGTGDNARALGRVADRLGGVLDPTAPRVDPQDIVFGIVDLELLTCDEGFAPGPFVLAECGDRDQT